MTLCQRGTSEHDFNFTVSREDTIPSDRTWRSQRDVGCMQRNIHGPQ